MKNKLQDLNKRLKKFEKKNLKKNLKIKKNNDLGLFIKAGVELISPIIVGIVIGIFLDNHFNSKPLFLIIFLFLGFGGGISNIYKTVKRLGFEVGFKKKK